MTMKIYLIFVKYKRSDPTVDVSIEKIDAINEARNKLYNQSNIKSGIREFENALYFGVNLAEGIMAWVEEREILVKSVFTTSSVPIYSMELR